MTVLNLLLPGLYIPKEMLSSKLSFPNSKKGPSPVEENKFTFKEIVNNPPKV